LRRLEIKNIKQETKTGGGGSAHIDEDQVLDKVKNLMDKASNQASIAEEMEEGSEQDGSLRNTAVNASKRT